MKRLLIVILFLSTIFLVGCKAEDEQLDEDNNLLPQVDYFDDNYDEVIKDLDSYNYKGDDYVLYLNDIYNDESRVYSTAGTITYGVDYYGNDVSLYDGTNEVVYEKGLASWGNFASYTIVNVAEYGYDTFETYVGTTISTRETEMTPSFEVRIVCDGVTTDTIEVDSHEDTQVFLSVDLTGVEVLQIYLDNLGNGIGDFMGLGDPLLRKNIPNAYLDVFDLEFNQADQVTVSNLLEYPEAIDIDGNDISNDVKFTTNYELGQTGEFDLTYYVYDSNDVLRRRDVKLTVTGQDYSEAWTIEDFKTPYVNYMYHARQAYPEQMKRLFDLVVENAIAFDENDWERRWRTDAYPSQNYQVFNLQENGIYLKYNDANKLLRGMHDSEPRSYMILNLDLLGHYYTKTDPETGLLTAIGLWAQNKTNAQYDAEIELILGNTERFLAEAKDDMTYAQSWKYATDAYGKWMTYTDGAFINSSLGLGKGKCNGNSMGLVHIAHRLNIKSIYSEGMSSAGFHAWSYQKLPDEDAWYITDKLWGSTLRSVEAHGHQVYTNRGYDFITISDVDYDTKKFTYPSVWAKFKHNTMFVKQGNTFDLMSNITSLDSIYDGEVTNSNVTVELYNGSQSIDINSINNLSLGIYKVTYTIVYNGFTTTYQLDLAVYNNFLEYTEIENNLSELSLYNSDKTYSAVTDYDQSDEIKGKGFALNDGASRVIDVSSLNANTLSLKYGTSISTRTNNWTMANGKVSLSIYADGVLIYQGSQLTAWSHYEDIFVLLPEGTQELKFVSNRHGSGGNHSSLVDIVFGKTS